MLTLAAAAALAAAPAFAQAPPVQNRTKNPTPIEGQAGGRATATAGQNAGQAGNRPIAGQSVPAGQVGQTGGLIRTGVGRLPAAGVVAGTGVNDALFAAAAADSGLSEVTISELGAQRASDPELRRFSEQMIEQHTRLNNELRTLAARKGIKIPEMVDVQSQFCAQSLAGLSGEKFDECYAKAQLVAHMGACEMFTAEAERGADPDMRAMAAKALTHIKAHLNEIKPIAKRYMKEKEESEGQSHIGQPGGRPIR